MNTSNNTTRRDFLKTSGLAAAAVSAGAIRSLADEADSKPAKNPIPRWRGFNLTDFFQAFSSSDTGVISEDDCRWMRDWDFDFVRLPTDYWFWIDSDWRKTRKITVDDMFKIDERGLEKLDLAIETVNRFGLHMHINLHRGPGYCVNNPDREPVSLWTDKRAEDAFDFHWDVLARRYRGIPSEKLSFNLVNEAPSPRDGYMTREDYRRVMARSTETVRRHNPDRLVMIDGLTYGNLVVDEMVPMKVAQSVHGYTPAGISHYHASWVDRNMSFPMPTWPLLNENGSVKCDRVKLEAHYRPWGELARQGIGVHCGEVGCYNKTPHDVAIAWMSDVLDIIKSHEIGYAIWNFRGTFGILDSGRTDVEYDDWHGHKLDRRMLELLQRS